MNGGDPRDALYAALLRGDYSGITEDPSYPVENPRVVPLGLEQMMIQQQNAMEPEMTSRGIDQGYGRQMPIGQQNGRGMMSSATQGGNAAIPQNTTEYKIDAPTFAAAFRKMAELGAPEGVNFVWYSNGKPQGLYKYAYAGGQSRPASKPKPPAIEVAPNDTTPPGTVNPNPPNWQELSPLQIDRGTGYDKFYRQNF